MSGYIPASTNIQTVSSTQIPQAKEYSPSGVRFEGFSKNQGSNNTSINKQDRIACNAASDSSFTLFDPSQGKAFYMTDLVIQSPGASTNEIYITDGTLASASGVLFTIYQSANFNIVLHFEVPVKFNDFVRVSLLVGGSQKVYCNAIGWVEDK